MTDRIPIMSPFDTHPSYATITGQRWCVRIMSLMYYFALGPFLYDLFAHGARWRSAYLFPYVLLSVSGLQIGFKESDIWVRAWYWANFFFVLLMTYLSFFSKPFADFMSHYPWEKWIHFGLLITSVAFFPLHFFLKRKLMKVEDSDWDANLEDVDRALLPPVSNLKKYELVNPAVTATGRSPQTPPPATSPPHEDGGFLGH